MKVSGLFFGEHLKRLSETGDPLEMLAKITRRFGRSWTAGFAIRMDPRAVGRRTMR